MFAVVAAVVVGLAFLVSGVAKLARPELWRAQALALGAPAAVVPVLPFVEVLVGACLIVQWQRPAVSLAAVALLAAFTALLAVRISQGRRPPCACFGSLSTKPIGPQHLLRNTALIALALVAALA